MKLAEEEEKRKKAEVRAQKFMESASLMANAIKTEKKSRFKKKKTKTITPIIPIIEKS